MKRIVSLLVALVMLFSLSIAEETERVELMTLGGYPLYLDDIENLLTANDIDPTDTSYYLSALEFLIQNDIGVKLLAGDPAAVLGEEHYNEVVAEAGAYYDESVAAYVEYYATEESTEDDKAALALEAVEAFGITREDYVERMALNDAYQLVLDGLDVTVTDEEIQEAFDAEVAYEMAAVSNVTMYEYYTNYMGYSFFFTPEGYRGVLHILLSADEDLLTAYSSAEDDAAKTAAADAVVASVQDTVDEIYAKFAAGTSFQDLIAEYNTDPGMQDADTLAEGYAVHQDSILFVSEFTEGAFSEKMVQPGDISDPVVTTHGVHIMYYLRDIPGGAVEMTDSIKELLSDELIESKQTEAINEMLKAYEATYTDAYTQYIGEDNFLMK